MKQQLKKEDRPENVHWGTNKYDPPAGSYSSSRAVVQGFVKAQGTNLGETYSPLHEVYGNF